jgi:AraC-like DNA-binding protein
MNLEANFGAPLTDDQWTLVGEGYRKAYCLAWTWAKNMGRRDLGSRFEDEAVASLLNAARKFRPDHTKANFGRLKALHFKIAYRRCCMLRRRLRDTRELIKENYDFRRTITDSKQVVDHVVAQEEFERMLSHMRAVEASDYRDIVINQLTMKEVAAKRKTSEQTIFRSLERGQGCYVKATGDKR